MGGLNPGKANPSPGFCRHSRINPPCDLTTGMSAWPFKGVCYSKRRKFRIVPEACDYLAGVGDGEGAGAGVADAAGAAGARALPPAAGVAGWVWAAAAAWGW